MLSIPLEGKMIARKKDTIVDVTPEEAERADQEHLASILRQRIEAKQDIELPFEPDNPNDITVEDAAKALERHPNTIRKWIYQGILPAYKTKGQHSSKVNEGSYELRVRIPFPKELILNTTPIIARPKENIRETLANELERTRLENERLKSERDIMLKEREVELTLATLKERINRLEKLEDHFAQFADSYKDFYQDYKLLKQDYQTSYGKLTEKVALLEAPKLPWYKRVFRKSRA